MSVGSAPVRRYLPLLCALAVVALAAFVRFDDLGHPDRIYFDESYYVEDARSYLERGVEEQRPAHPPLGKWVIAAGIAVVGDDPVGWRSANALLGTLTVAGVIAVGRGSTRRWWPALLAGLLVALDGLAVVSSRIGMLDASLAWWVTAAAGALVVDHRRPGTGRWPGPWRVAAGLLLGAAVATKWSGVLALPVAAVLVLWTDLRARRLHQGTDAGGPPGWLRVTGALALRVVLPLALVPVAAYVASYLPWMANYEHTETAQERCEEGSCGTGIGDRLAGFWYEQRELVAFHDRLEARHPDRSEAWRWPLLDEPVLMFLERCKPDATACPYDADERRTIVGLGSPVLWWPSLVAVPALAVLALRRRWWAGVAVAGLALGQWAPWLLSPKPGFSFYLIPVVPFAALSLALACTLLPLRLQRAAGVVLAVLAVAAFVFWRPLYTGAVLDPSALDLRAWFPSWD